MILRMITGLVAKCRWMLLIAVACGVLCVTWSAWGTIDSFLEQRVSAGDMAPHYLRVMAIAGGLCTAAVLVGGLLAGRRTPSVEGCECAIQHDRITESVTGCEAFITGDRVRLKKILWMEKNECMKERTQNVNGTGTVISTRRDLVSVRFPNYCHVIYFGPDQIKHLDLA